MFCVHSPTLGTIRGKQKESNECLLLCFWQRQQQDSATYPPPTLRGATHVPGSVPALGTDRYTCGAQDGTPGGGVLTPYNRALPVSSCTGSASRAVRPAAVQRTLSEELHHRVLSRSSEAKAGCGMRDVGRCSSENLCLSFWGFAGKLWRMPQLTTCHPVSVFAFMGHSPRSARPPCKRTPVTLDHRLPPPPRDLSQTTSLCTKPVPNVLGLGTGTCRGEARSSRSRDTEERPEK